MGMLEIMIDTACFRQRCAAHAAEEAQYCIAHNLPKIAAMWQEEAADSARRAINTLQALIGRNAIVEKRS